MYFPVKVVGYKIKCSTVASMTSVQEVYGLTDPDTERLVALFQHVDPQNFIADISSRNTKKSLQKKLDDIIFQAVCPDEVTDSDQFPVSLNEDTELQLLNNELGPLENEENKICDIYDEDDVQIIENPSETIIIIDGDDDAHTMQEYLVERTSKSVPDCIKKYEETDPNDSQQTHPTAIDMTTTYEFTPNIKKVREHQELINDFTKGLTIVDTVDVDVDSKAGNRAIEHEPDATDIQPTCNVTFRWFEWTLKTNITKKPQAPWFNKFCTDAAWKPPKMPRAVDSVSNEFLWFGDEPDTSSKTIDNSEIKMTRMRSLSGSNSIDNDVKEKSKVSESIASRLRPRAASVRVPGRFQDTTSKLRQQRPFQRNVGDCPICHENLASKYVASTICGHLFCMECIREYIHTCHGARHCPTCRKVFKKGQSHNRFFI